MAFNETLPLGEVRCVKAEEEIARSERPTNLMTVRTKVAEGNAFIESPRADPNVKCEVPMEDGNDEPGQCNSIGRLTIV